MISLILVILSLLALAVALLRYPYAISGFIEWCLKCIPLVIVGGFIIACFIA